MNSELGPLLLADACATEVLGARLAEVLRGRRGWVLFLRGELGTGKTTLARACLRALGVVGAIRSPTYTLVEPYNLGDAQLLHLDLYRLKNPAELEQLGLADTPPLAGGWLVEWPELGGDAMPAADIELRLHMAGSQRRVEATVAGAWCALLRPVFEEIALRTTKNIN